MQRQSERRVETALVIVVAIISVLGFWQIYLGPRAAPQLHHHAHLATTFAWMGLLLVQLRLIAAKRFASHRFVGMAVLVIAPLLVATTVMLTIHSAHRAWSVGEDDFLIVQNVMSTIELALLIALAFAFRKQREVHGSLLLSTLISFGGIALFFALLSFAPPFRIEGPETFYRFGMAAMTSQGIWLTVALAMFLRNRRDGWPYLLAGGFLLLNVATDALIRAVELAVPLTAIVGKADAVLVPITSGLLMGTILAALIRPVKRQPSSSPA